MHRRKPNVLAVDDKRANLLALEAVLGEDCNLTVRSSAAEAIDFLKSQPGAVDLILMDVQMPGMDGFEATAHIKRLPGCEDIPVIFVTAVFTEDPWVKQGYAAGGVDYFVKPFDVGILKKKITIYTAYKIQEELVKAQARCLAELQKIARVGTTPATLLDEAGVGVLLCDRRGRICVSTSEVADILGSAGPDESGPYGEVLRWLDASGGRMSQDSKGPLARALNRGEASRSEPIPVRRVDETWKAVQVLVSPLHGRGGRVVGAMVTLRSLTESRTTIKKQLQRRVSELIGLN